MAVPRSIDATGRIDVTRPLERFLAAVPNDTTVRFAPFGRYRIEGTLDLKNRRDLTFDGEGATLFATARGAGDRSQWWVHDGAGITFRDMHVRGANLEGGTAKAAYVKKLETQHGIRLEGVDGAEVDRVTVTNVYGDFVYVGRDGAGRPSRQHLDPRLDVPLERAAGRRRHRRDRRDHRAQLVREPASLHHRSRTDRPPVAR